MSVCDPWWLWLVVVGSSGALWLHAMVTMIRAKRTAFRVEEQRMEALRDLSRMLAAHRQPATGQEEGE